MRRDRERLADILEASDKIARRGSLGREHFDGDEDPQIVLVHLVQVVGETASGLSDALTSAHPETPWRQIIATRNRVVHGYFDVDVDILWDVVTVDVPQLARQVRAIFSTRSAVSDT